MASYASIEPARPSSQTSFHPHHLSYRQHPGLELMQVAGIYCYLLLGIQPALYRYPRYGFAVRILVSRRNEVSKSLTFFVFCLFVVSGLCGHLQMVAQSENGGCGVLRPYGRLLRVAFYASIEPARPSSQTSFHPPHHLSYRQHPGLELMQVAGIYCYLLLGIQPALYRYPRYGFAVRILVSRRNEVSNLLTFFVFCWFVQMYPWLVVLLWWLSHNGGCGVLRPYGRLLRVASYASIEPLQEHCLQKKG